MKNNSSRIDRKLSDSNGDLNENGISEPNISEIRHGLEALDGLMNKYIQVGGNKIKDTTIQSLSKKLVSVNKEANRKSGGVRAITYKRNLNEEYIPGGEINKNQDRYNGRRASSRNSNEKLEKKEYNQFYHSELFKEMRKKKVKSDDVLETVKYNEKSFGLSKSKFRLSEAELTVVNGGSSLKLNKDNTNRSTFSEEEPSILLDRSFDRDNSLNLDDDITFSKIETMLIEPQKQMESNYQKPSLIQVDKKIKQDRGDLSTSFLEGVSNVRENSIDDLNEITFENHLNNNKLDIRLEDDILHNLSLPEKLFKFNLSGNSGEAFDILENKETDQMFYNKSETELLTINRKKEGINQSQVKLTAAQKLKVELQNIELETKKVNIDRILNKNYYGNYNPQHSTPLCSKRNYTSNDKIELDDLNIGNEIKAKLIKLDFYKKVEDNYMIDYTELIQLGFSVELRSTMIGNLATLCTKLELPKDVLFESVHHMDRFLTCHKLVKHEHIIYTSQLCFYFAMYLFKSECIPFNEFLNICNVDLNRHKVSRYFKRINYFIMDNYRTYIPINDYLELFAAEQKGCLNPLFKQIFKYLMEVTLYNEKFYEYKKSLVVTSLVQVTKEMLHIKGLIFNSHTLNKEKEKELKLIQQLLKHSIKAIPNYPSDHTYSKEYKHVLFIVKSYYGLTETN